MPLPFSFNIWACNIWQPEPDREAAAAAEAHGIFFRPALDQIVVTPLPPVETGGFGDVPLDAAELQAALTADWPEVPPVIAAELHVTDAQDKDVEAFFNAALAAEGEDPLTHIECYHRAAYQLHLAGFGTTGRPPITPGNFQLLKEWPRPEGVVEERDAEATVEAVRYLKEALGRGMPSLVGIRLNTWENRPNERGSTPWIEPTNHFVVIVGMGTDDNGAYFSYYDYMHRPHEGDRFYLREDLRLNDRFDLRSLVEVRRSWRK